MGDSIFCVSIEDRFLTTLVKRQVQENDRVQRFPLLSVCKYKNLTNKRNTEKSVFFRQTHESLDFDARA
jgi:hypothetical protein